jgi:hypothetical protein
MAGQADAVFHFVQRQADFAQDDPGIGLHVGAGRIEHGPVLVVHDLDAQTLAGEVEQQLVLELGQLAVGVDQGFQLALEALQLGGFRRSKSAFSRCRLMVFFPIRCPLLDLAVRRPSGPCRPPGSGLEESPEPEPPPTKPSADSGKNSAMPFRSPCVVEPSSHIRRKKAIIAVTKSA